MATSKRQREAAASHLNSAAIHLLRGMRAVDRMSGITPARLSALSVLVFGGDHSLGELAGAQDVSPPTMTRVVDGLVRLGLAERSPDPRSARQVRISATDEGHALMRAAARRRIEVIAAALAELPPAERDAVVAAAPALRTVSTSVPRLAQERATTGD